MTSTIIAAPRPRPKLSVRLALVLCPALVLVGACALWSILNNAVDPANISDGDIPLMVGLLTLCVVGLVLLTIMAAQRFEYDRLSRSYQGRVDQMQRRLNAQEDFLRSMVDYTPETITIFDKNNNYWFVNASAARTLKSDPTEVVGKPILKVLGHEKSRKVLQRLETVRTEGKAIDALDQITTDGKVQFIQTHYQTIDGQGEFAGGILVREEDITPYIIERERRETMLRQVINTLVAVVDRRDPYASGHSQRVGQLSRALAEELVLSELEIETAETAGSLMNFGKMLVSRQILTKTVALTTEELQRVRDGIMTSADILSMIDFVGPVVPTLRQVLERMDGTGAPKNLKGEQILMTARIVAVANAFVALASPRAHRPSLDLNDALNRIKNDADKAFDRRVVTALANCIENRAEKLSWLRQPAMSA